MSDEPKVLVPPFVSEYVKLRPDFGPMQIKNAEDLKAGMKVLLCSNIGGKRNEDEVEILDSPYLDAAERRSGKLICDVRSWSERLEKLVVRRMYLEDRNIVPYANSTWNPFCWIEKKE